MTKGWALVAGMVAIAGGARASDPQVETLLGQMRAAYKAVKAAHLKVECRLEQFTLNADMLYKSPSKMKVSVTSDRIKGAMVRVTDGKSVSTRNPGSTGNTTQKYTKDNFEMGLPLNLESLCLFDYARQLSTERGNNMEHSALKIRNGRSWNGKQWLVLEETATAQKVFVTYYIDAKTFLIWRTVAQRLDTKKQIQDCSIKKLDLSPNIPDSAFKPSVSV